VKLVTDGADTISPGREFQKLTILKPSWPTLALSDVRYSLLCNLKLFMSMCSYTIMCQRQRKHSKEMLVL